MDVSEFRKILETLPGDMPVVLAKDSEGNAYREAVAWDTCPYELSDGFGIDLLDEEDASDGDPVALVLWPT